MESLLKMEEKIAEAAPSPSKIEKACTLRSIPTNAKIKERTNRLDQRKAISFFFLYIEKNDKENK